MSSSCLINNFTKKEKQFETRAGIVIRNISAERIWEFHPNDIGWIHYKNGVVTDRGKWECDGEENFKIIDTTKNRIYSSKTNEWEPYVNPDLPAQLDPAFSCVTQGLTSIGLSFEIKDNIYVVATLKSGTKWYFYQTKPGVRPWVEVTNKTMTLTGTWSCVGESNFQLTRSDGKTYVGGNTSWEGEGQPGQTTEGNPIFNCVKNYYADFEQKLRADLRNKTKYNYFRDYMQIVDPEGDGYENFFTDGKYEYYDKGNLFQQGSWVCKGERDYDVVDSDNPVADDSFPLKEGKRGPNVVKLQKFLNDKIPSNPLTVNGIFDEKTKNKLIEYQKKEGII